MPAVNSTAISFIDYDIDEKLLTIEFVKTGKYDFPNFPHDLYVEFLNSRSKGVFYNRYIRDKY